MILPAESDGTHCVIGPSGGKIIGYVGESPLYKQMVTVEDNVDEAPTLQVNNKSVNINKEGEYKVYYRATDAAGNMSSTYTLIYVVKSKEYSRDTLMELIEEKADALGITKEMTKVEQVRKIYAYVNSKSTIAFTNESNIPDINRKNWEIDWVEEAIRGLDSGEGDCYTYYSLSKAFFEYFGIENKGIQRSENYSGAAEDGTHFWSVVKVEGGWYYYDSTRLGSTFSDGTTNACLITEKKLKTYETENFYAMTKSSGFPTISSKELD